MTKANRTGGIFAVAGVAYARRQAKQCRREWNQLFHKYGGCHMTDLALKQQQFEGISNTEAHRLIQRAVIQRAVSIMNKYSSFGVAVSCDINELEPLSPKWIFGFEGAYPVCCHMAMTVLGKLAGQTEEIAYIFESGQIVPYLSDAKYKSAMWRIALFPIGRSCRTGSTKPSTILKGMGARRHAHEHARRLLFCLQARAYWRLSTH